MYLNKTSVDVIMFAIKNNSVVIICDVKNNYKNSRLYEGVIFKVNSANYQTNKNENKDQTLKHMLNY